MFGQGLFNIEANETTPEQIARNRRLFEAMLQPGQVRYTGEGLTKGIAAAIGGFGIGRDNRLEREARGDFRDTLRGMLFGGDPATASTSGAPVGSYSGASGAAAPEPLNRGFDQTADMMMGEGLSFNRPEEAPGMVREGADAMRMSGQFDPLPISGAIDGVDPGLQDMAARAWGYVVPGGRIDVSTGVSSHSPVNHLPGHALDYQVTRPDGTAVNWNDPEAIQAAQIGRSLGVLGIGGGQEYMGGNRFHWDVSRNGARTWSDSGANQSPIGFGQAEYASQIAAATGRPVEEVLAQLGISPGDPQQLAFGPTSERDMMQPEVAPPAMQATASARNSSGQPPARQPQGAQLAQANPSMEQLYQLAMNPWATPAERQVIMGMIQQQQQAADPMRQLQMEQLRLQVEQMRNPQADIPDSVEALDLRAQRAGLVPGTPEYQQFMLAGGSGPMVDFSGAQFGPTGEVGTIPQGFELFTDQDGNRSMRPIPGGPEDTTQSEAAAAGMAQTRSDVLLDAATAAFDASQNRAVDGRLGSMVGREGSWFYNPESDNAEAYRQVETLRSLGRLETLQAMRASSPTGAAMGNMSDGEGRALEVAIGALDPASPNFQRDLARVTRNLLRTIHGPEAGDAMFAETPLAPIIGDEGGSRVPERAPEARQSRPVQMPTSPDAFASMSRDDLLQIDIGELSGPMLDAYERRWMEVR